VSDDAGFLRTIEDWKLIEGAPAPLGATWAESRQAYNFALYSRSATGVTLLLYTEADPVVPVHQIQFDPQINKTGRIWHCWAPAGQVNGATMCAGMALGRLSICPTARTAWPTICTEPPSTTATST
jgi:isoamylase